MYSPCKEKKLKFPTPGRKRQTVNCLFRGEKQEKQQNFSAFHSDISPCFSAKTIIVTWVLGKIKLYLFSPVKKEFRSGIKTIET